MRPPKKLLLLTLFLFCFVISIGQNIATNDSEPEKEQIKEKKSRLSLEFARIATGNTFSTIGNYASIGTTGPNTLSASMFFLKQNGDVINIKASGGATQGIVSIFDEGELNSNVSIGASYNLLFRKGNNAIAINSTAEDIITSIMDAFFGLLTFVLFVTLLIGLIKPSLVLRWTKEPTRLKVFGFWLIGIIGMGIIAVATSDEEEIAKSYIESANTYNKAGKYEKAKKELKKVKESNTFYKEAQQLLIITDSLSKLTEEQKVKAKEEALAKTQAEEKTKQKEQLERELKSITNGIDFSSYRETIESLQIELVLFGAWAETIKKGISSDDVEIKNLANELKSKVEKIQVKEFPILRKEYAKIVAKKMWENDIDITSSGNGHRVINFSGGIFAANKNKQDVQTELNEILTMFRFNQARYRWYKGEDEYTYYTMYEGKDSDLVEFKK